MHVHVSSTEIFKVFLTVQIHFCTTLSGLDRVCAKPLGTTSRGGQSLDLARPLRLSRLVLPSDSIDLQGFRASAIEINSIAPVDLLYLYFLLRLDDA